MEPTGQTVSKTSRDTSFMLAATVLGAAIGDRLELDAQLSALLGSGIFFVISFGWRALRHYAPWVADESA